MSLCAAIADPSIAKRLIAGETEKAPTPEATLEIFHILPWFVVQLERIGEGAGSYFIGTGGGREIWASGDNLYGAVLGKTPNRPGRRSMRFSSCALSITFPGRG